jgi:hypothetical protein
MYSIHYAITAVIVVRLSMTVRTLSIQPISRAVLHRDYFSATLYPSFCDESILSALFCTVVGASVQKLRRSVWPL